MKLTLVTCTGERPEAFVLCQLWMSRQTLKPHQWLVLDDGIPPSHCLLGQEHIHCPQFRGPMSLLDKIAFVIKSGKITGEGLVFVEDDDWYGPKWLQFCSDKLAKYDLIGEGGAIYYNVKYRSWYDHHNTEHASLCSTAVRSSALGLVLDRCGHDKNKDPFLDQRIWLDQPRMKCSSRVFMNGRGRMVVGIKGMPGRGGYNVGHGRPGAGWRPDGNMSELKSLVGPDWEMYEPFWSE